MYFSALQNVANMLEIHHEGLEITVQWNVAHVHLVISRVAVNRNDRIIEPQL